MRRSGPYERTSNQKPTTGIAAEKKEEENRKKNGIRFLFGCVLDACLQ